MKPADAQRAATRKNRANARALPLFTQAGLLEELAPTVTAGIGKKANQ